MNKDHTPVSRRKFLTTSAAGGILAATIPSIASAKSPAAAPTSMNGPLAQDYVVVARVPDRTKFIHDPAMEILPNGTLVAASPIWGRQPPREKNVEISRSKDGGKTWEVVSVQPWAEACLFVYQGKLYMFTQLVTWEGVWVSMSEDEGKTWTTAVEVIKGAPNRQHWNIQLGMVVKNGWLYWANGKAYQDMGAVACDLGKGLLNPAAWIASNVLVMPIPNEVVWNSFTSGATMRCLEGNVVHVGGKLLVIARAVINRYGTANMAAVFELKHDAGKLELSFAQLYPVPGGQCKFHILYDEKSKMFWMASNYPTNSQDLIRAAQRFPDAYSGTGRTVREDRRILMLSYSLDALNWFTAGCIAKAEKLTQSFMYPTMVFDGEDIALLSRSARDSGDYHDADLATFHRVRNFRSLAMDVTPKF